MDAPGVGECAKSRARPQCLMVTFAQHTLTSSHRLQGLSLQSGLGLGPLCSAQLPWLMFLLPSRLLASVSMTTLSALWGLQIPPSKAPGGVCIPIQCPGAELGLLLKPLTGGPARWLSQLSELLP